MGLKTGFNNGNGHIRPDSGKNLSGGRNEKLFKF